jgi:hypothetical protein
MRKVLMGLSLIISMVASQTIAFAWGDTGHMVVAQIAYSRLNPTAKARVDELVSLLKFGGKTYNHVTVANMMDDFRGDESKNRFKPWHFTNDPFFDGIDPKDLNLPEINAEERINFIVEKFKSGGFGSDLKDAQHLAYLIHLVGDIHQPLHTTSRYSAETPNGDLGGNSFLIQGPRRNLHSYWDAGGGLFGFKDVQRPLSREGWKSITDYAFEARKAYPFSSPEWKDMDVSHWVKEGHDLALSSAYDGIEQHTRPSEEYQERAQEVCRKRLAMGGYRLGQLINDIYPRE